MKNILLFIFIFLSFCEFSCVKIHKKIINGESTSMKIDNPHENLIKKKTSVPIDTTEFLKYWKNFTYAILNHDSNIATLINDTVTGNCSSLHFKENDLPSFFGGKMTKSIFCIKIYDLFTEPYLKLLNKYNIEKDIESQKENDWQNAYRCEMSFNGKEYTAGISFEKDIVVFSMGYSIGDNLIFVNLEFKKTELGEIKLFNLVCKSANISG